MISRIGLHACNGASFKLAPKSSSLAAALKPRLAQHRRSVTSLATAFQSSTRAKQASSSTSSLLFLIAGGTSLFAYSVQNNPLRCDPTTNQSARPYAEPHTVSVQGPGSAKLTRRNEEPAIESTVDLKSLSFGAVAGISTGIFIKKGLKAVGFLLGGAFVLLQYLGSRSLVSVDWKSMASRYDTAIDKFAGPGTGSRLARLSNSVLDFLMADFPPRATFAAGVVLGLRIG